MPFGVSRPDIRVATCRMLPEPDPDALPLRRAFERAGVRATWVPWDDSDAVWQSPTPTVLRSTWNYWEDRSAFVAFCQRVAARCPLWNPCQIVRMNTHKGYLRDLRSRGLPIVPTFFSDSDAAPIAQARDAGWAQVVIKPAVGAGSVGTRSFGIDDPAARGHFDRLTGQGDVLVQPLLTSVAESGEDSLVWIDGELSHQVRKAPRFAGEAECVSGPVQTDASLRDLADRILSPWTDQLLYARIDLARGPDGEPMIMELELTEPSLFFDRCPGSADRFVAGLLRRL